MLLGIFFQNGHALIQILRVILPKRQALAFSFGFKPHLWVLQTQVYTHAGGETTVRNRRK